MTKHNAKNERINRPRLERGQPVADSTTDNEERCPFTTLAPSAQATDGDS